MSEPIDVLAVCAELARIVGQIQRSEVVLRHSSEPYTREERASLATIRGLESRRDELEQLLLEHDTAV